VVEEKGIQQQAIMHKLNVMDQKFDSLCREVFNIEITVNNYSETQNNSMDEVDQVMTSVGTLSNLILLDDERDAHMDKYYWKNQGHGS